MRLRVGVVLCLLLAYLGVACRTPLAPNIDRDIAPETWITAAPPDTIMTERGTAPDIGTIPFRFHLYWAASDRDGAVAGFYWAVVETLPSAPPEAGPGAPIPPLPGPKPGDYHFTTKTDSIFIFRVAEQIPDRAHAFFIYAVDNQGKPDPTPARFIFNAKDRFPPTPVFDEAFAVGKIYERLPGGGVRAVIDTFPRGRVGPLRILDINNPATLPTDTVPVGSDLHFCWHAKIDIPGTVVTSYRYKLDEPQLVTVGPHDTCKVYGQGQHPTPGTKIFTVRAIDQALGSNESNRRLQYNFSPISWWAGPDPNDPALMDNNGEKFLPMSIASTSGIPRSLLSADSTQILPASRAERRTFLEIWRDTVFVRKEFDTVHMNSFVIFHGGGFDTDSRYGVHVTDLARRLPEFPGGPVLEPSEEPNGSPVGFRSQVQLLLDPAAENNVTRALQTGLYPIFDPNDVFNQPRIGGYHLLRESGKAYAVIRAEDADGSRDLRVEDPVGLVERVAAGGGTPQEQQLRDQVLVFYVNQPPHFLLSDPGFQPKPGAVFTSRTWDFVLMADDSDPYLSGIPGGGPAGTGTLRRQVTIHGFDVNTNEPLTYVDFRYLNREEFNVLVPDNLKPGDVQVDIELCDCDQCEFLPGTGRCTKLTIPVIYQPLGAQ